MIYVAAYRGKGIISTLIRFRTWSKYSHVAVMNEHGEIIEAWQRGGVCYRANHHQGHRPGTQIDCYSYPLPHFREELLWRFMCGQVGRGYDYFGVLGFLTRRDKAHNPERWFCSELVMAASIACGDPLLRGIAPHRVSPGDVVTSPLLNYSHKLIV